MVEVRMFWEAIHQCISSTTFRSETTLYVAASVRREMPDLPQTRPFQILPTKQVLAPLLVS